MLVKLAFAAFAAITLLSTLVHADAYTRLRAPTEKGNGPSLKSIGKRPRGAVATSIPVGTSGAEVFAWTRKGTGKEAFVLLHGIKRNAEDYFRLLYRITRDEHHDATLVAPLLFSADRDAEALNTTTLAWGDPNAWSGGDGSTHPRDSNISPFEVLDAIVKELSATASEVTLMAHGGGAQLLQRYAVLGQDAPSGTSIRYVIGDPSSMLYFTQDRPVRFDPKACPEFNEFRYGFGNYTAPYPLVGSPSELFSRYMSRDVRYVVGLEDVKDKGDQLCAGRAAGGPRRRDRSLAYWTYLHALANITPLPSYPGRFPALDPRESHHASDYVTSSPAERSRFASTPISFRHQLFTVEDAGHNAALVFGSGNGSVAVFGPAASPASSSVASGTATGATVTTLHSASAATSQHPNFLTQGFASMHSTFSSAVPTRASIVRTSPSAANQRSAGSTTRPWILPSMLAMLIVYWIAWLP
ncbi:unnamed protein product [Parajaminaea phylloscopi]